MRQLEAVLKHRLGNELPTGRAQRVDVVAPRPVVDFHRGLVTRRFRFIVEEPAVTRFVSLCIMHRSLIPSTGRKIVGVIRRATSDADLVFMADDRRMGPSRETGNSFQMYSHLVQGLAPALPANSRPVVDLHRFSAAMLRA